MDIQQLNEHQFSDFVTFLTVCDSKLYAGLANGAIYSVEDGKQLVDGGSTLTGFSSIDKKIVFTRQDQALGIVDSESKVCHTLKTNYPCASSDVKDQRVVIGTELKTQDAGLLIYALGHGLPEREFMDAHADDVTDVRWHPTEQNVVISGSTDGTVNLYNLSQQDDDEVIYQTVNHGASIHRVGFLSKDRFFALSHMETLSIYQVANPDENVAEPAPVEFGDLREAWGCEYVADFVDGYFLVGSNNQSTARLIPFDNQTPQLLSAYNLKGAHGEEVIRCFCFLDGILYTGGEDGKVKAWKVPIKKAEKKKDKEVKRANKLKSKKKEGHNPY